MVDVYSDISANDLEEISKTIVKSHSIQGISPEESTLAVYLRKWCVVCGVGGTASSGQAFWCQPVMITSPLYRYDSLPVSYI